LFCGVGNAPATRSACWVRFVFVIYCGGGSHKATKPKRETAEVNQGRGLAKPPCGARDAGLRQAPFLERVQRKFLGRRDQGDGEPIPNPTRTYRANNTRNQLTHQWGPATSPLRHLYDSFGGMSGLHTWRPGDPGAWNSETIPAAFISSSPDVTTTRNRSLGPSSATLSRIAERARQPRRAPARAWVLQQSGVRRPNRLTGTVRPTFVERTANGTNGTNPNLRQFLGRARRPRRAAIGV